MMIAFRIFVQMINKHLFYYNKIEISSYSMYQYLQKYKVNMTDTIPLYNLQYLIILGESYPFEETSRRPWIPVVHSMKNEIMKRKFIKTDGKITVKPRVLLDDDEIEKTIKYFKEQSINCVPIGNGLLSCDFLERS